MSNWIKWKQWTEDGLVGFGQMPIKNVDKELYRFANEAANVLKSTGADHVLYGVKVYDENDELDEVKFYMLPMDDETFYKDVANKTGVVVYALHKKG